MEKLMTWLLKRLLNKSIKQTEKVWRCIKRNKLEHRQEVLEWLDKLNEISVRN